jgi:hypothetical protein
MFIASIENSFITVAMVNELLQRWHDISNPLYLTPKDFKERILTTALDQEIKLNYLKWLQHGLEIDMQEILSVLIVYTRASLEDCLELLFKLYSSDKDSDSM